MSRHRIFAVVLIASTILLGRVAPATAQNPQRGRMDPKLLYYEAMQYYRDGDLQNAIRGFELAGRGAKTDPGGKWIDAIPSRVMLAECYWQLGHLPACRSQLDAAAGIAIRHRGWIGQIDYSVLNTGSQIKASPSNLWPEVAAVRLLPLPSSMPLHMGRAVTEQSLAAGGVIQAPSIEKIDAIEIMRCLAVLSHRRRVLLGPLAMDDSVSRELTEATKLPSRLNQPLARSLLHAMRGCEYYAVGEDKTVLDRANKYASPGGVHPITPLLLLSAMKVGSGGDDAGKLSAQARSQIVSTAQQVVNASAALGQYEWIGEALQIGVGVAGPEQLGRVEQTALLAGRTLVRESRLTSLHCYLVAADAALSAGRTDVAAEHLQTAIALASRRDVNLPRLQAYGSYLTARLAAMNGQAIGWSGSGEMASSMKSITDFILNRRDQRRTVISMPFLYQADIVMASLSGNVGNQSAKRVLSGFSGAVGVTLWRQDPLNALAAVYFDDSAMHSSLLQMAAMENDGLEVLRQTDHLLAKRFTSQLPLQGRVLQLRTLASSPADSLWPHARDVIANPPPAFARLRDQTQAALLAAAQAEPPSVRPEPPARVMEAELSDLALSRVRVPEINPPPVAKTDVVEIPDGVVLLSFVIDSGKIIASASRDGATRTWVVPGANRLPAAVNRLLQEIGASRTRGKRLPENDTQWKSTAQKIRSFLFPEASGWTEEGLTKIMVVPDGPLWYLPFELLPAPSFANPNEEEDPQTDEIPMWADAVELQYAPTPGLALRHVAVATDSQGIAMVGGNFFAVRDAATNDAMLNEVMSAAEGASLWTPETAPPTDRVGWETGHLIIAAPVVPNWSDPLSTSILPISNAAGKTAKRGGVDQLRSWIRYPSGGPRSVMIAGLRSSGSTTKLRDGSDLFFPMIALQSSGVREVGLSRWATGGASAATVLAEVASEIPYTSLTAALRRGTTMLRQTDLATTREPLLGNPDSEAATASGEQPLFWATYLSTGSLGLPPPEKDH